MTSKKFILFNTNKNDSTYWGPVTHICVNKLNIIGSDNGLPPDRRQSIISTNAGILFIWPFETNFSEMLVDIQTFSVPDDSSWERRPLCLSLIGMVGSIGSSTLKLHLSVKSLKLNWRSGINGSTSADDLHIWHNIRIITPCLAAEYHFPLPQYAIWQTNCSRWKIITGWIGPLEYVYYTSLVVNLITNSI